MKGFRDETKLRKYIGQFIPITKPEHLNAAVILPRRGNVTFETWVQGEADRLALAGFKCIAIRRADDDVILYRSVQAVDVASYEKGGEMVCPDLSWLTSIRDHSRSAAALRSQFTVIYESGGES